MIAWQEELQSAAPCETGRRDTVVKAYFTQANMTMLGYVRIGTYNPHTESLQAVLTETVASLNEQQTYGEVQIENLAAASVMQYCWHRRHQNGETTTHSRLERIGNFVIVRAGANPEEIEGHSRPSSSGIGSGRREQGLRGIQTLIHLPLCEDDSEYTDNGRIIRAAPKVSLGLEPYVLLNTKPGTKQTVETLAQLDSLQ
jgi:hypothetical protein